MKTAMQDDPGAMLHALGWLTKAAASLAGAVQGGAALESAMRQMADAMETAIASTTEGDMQALLAMVDALETIKMASEAALSGPPSGPLPTKPRKPKAATKTDAVKVVLAKLYPTGIPSRADLPSGRLCTAVRGELPAELRMPGAIADKTIMRAAYRT